MAFSGSAPAAVGPSSPSAPDEGLHRGLTERQLTMMAIGGAIGVGLFLGSSVTIALAGPGVIVTYVLGALVAMIVAYSLAEMAVVHPVAGAFGVYAERYLSPWAGYAVRATYAFIQIIAIGAEVTAVGIYFAFWFPAVPPWVWVASVSAGLVAVNASQVSRFGEFEYWFALIKVVAIVAFILIGGALILGLTGGPRLGLTNLTAHGGFLPNGWQGVWLALTLGITSYMGVEIIAITAGEAQDPGRAIPRAMRTIVFRLIAFYVLAITVMLAMTPWNRTAVGGITGSPFVRAFATAGIPYAAGLMNLVVISAALSSANTNLYTSTRMLFSLAREGYTSRLLAEVSRTGVPRYALMAAASGMLLAILLAVWAPERAFLLLYGTAVAGMFFVWIVVLLTHLRFRERLSREEVAQLPLRLPGHPFSTHAGIAALLAIAATTFVVDGLEFSVPAFVPFLLLVSLAYWQSRRPQPSI